VDHYNASISEDAAVGSTVLRVEAIDLDLDLNGKVTYLLEMTSAADVGHFMIDRFTGVVTLARYDDESYSAMTSFERRNFKLVA